MKTREPFGPETGRRNDMRVLAIVLMIGVCFMICACGRIYGPVEEVKALINEKDDVILQISKKIEDSPNEAGVDAARKVFNASKDGLKIKRKAIDEKPPGMNSDWMSMLLESNARDTKMFEAISSKFAVACWQVECESARAKLSQLEKDFKEVVK